jgi:DNA-binding PadR family transcriptional regulator
MTNAELAILSLLAEKERHGYEIEQVIAERGMRDWTEIGFSSIYFLLKKLEGAGLVVSQPQAAAGRGPARKVYHLTPAGREAWQAGILQTLSQPQRGSIPFQLGLSCLPGLPPGEVLAALRRYRSGLQERLDYVQARARAQQSLPPHVQAMFSHSQALISAELEWISSYIQELETSDDQAGS